MSTNLPMPVAGRISRRIGAVLILSLLAAGSVGATEPVYTVGHENPDKGFESFFTLDFGKFGESMAFISSTDIVQRFEFDGALGTAKFLDYFQMVDSLELPFGIETGDITIEILESENVSFDFDELTGTGEFTTNDIYAVYFTGDLSQFGIESPFIMPATSVGTITFETDTTGRVEMVWEGEGMLGEDPKTAIPYFYTCHVNTVFAIPGRADFDADGHVGLVDFGFLQRCFTGEGIEYGDDVCEMADFDLDSDVDGADYSVFVAHKSGG